MTSSSKQALEESIEAFESLKPQLEQLKTKVKEYLLKTETKVLDRKSEYINTLRELNQFEQELKHQVEIHEQLETELNNESRKLVDDIESSSAKFKEIKHQYAQLLKQKEKGVREIKEINDKIDTETEAINSKREFISNQSDIINNKTYEFEQLLGLTISTGGSDTESENNITFTFKNVDPDDFERCVSFTLDPINYKIVATEPLLEDEIVTRAMDNFTRHKEIGYLWKEMRSELRSMLLK